MVSGTTDAVDQHRIGSLRTMSSGGGDGIEPHPASAARRRQADWATGQDAPRNAQVTFLSGPGDVT
ncbi:hypothetical protein CJO78_20555 (plasmid) [Ralstonia solanacearum]|nr:hypothetical protein CJO76_20295 [Ralstonia solanacearum]AXV88705.1 hypothetical protein CJO78_20555 [Ralstonia solanacearum]AXV93314.1 hypothetical protein CJO79_20270 [Ralstonia solanacearum]AXW08177.1 hypothetical protein CJO82_20215 [Ralstonia solanacearum]AXW21351.1 hypothetical protein CJO85_20355 [Ralstonia solanacearum]